MKEFVRNTGKRIKNVFFVETPGTKKRELRLSRLKWMALFAVIVFVMTVLFMPTENSTQFSYTEKASDDAQAPMNSADGETQSPSSTASSLWAPPSGEFSSHTDSQVNYNTSMIVGPSGENARTELRAGMRLPIRIMDKFIVSQDEVPVLAELILDAETDSGLKLPAGTKVYGEASFNKGAERASIQFKQISLPSGQIRTISGIAAGKDGQPGIPGHVYSDGMKNTAGQILTTFIGGWAAGSMQTDVFGRSTGGIKNGLLNAVSQTATNRAEAYGEKLKTEREWIEVPAGQEADVILSQPVQLQTGGDSYEQR